MMTAILGTAIRASLARMKRQWYFPVANLGEYESQVMKALTSQARKIPINHIWRQFSPVGNEYHRMIKAPAILMQIGEIERKKIKAILGHRRSEVTH